ncbi:LPS export ABC transporter protein LptC [Litorivivens lipolytica]|uniref:LPS export ABC transporter protein LptC n=1 Tax=Litorivivens lipolytica TaxID=1524264 RepID=A0A7W4W446_9GAMM|nr:LPS export ABC transporter periplasmic protein LptC [Litorivivens lipolytica]MBB3047110.1 LPS export ABC transporter protein LptC [Litorivivens lipolytica]
MAKDRRRKKLRNLSLFAGLIGLGALILSFIEYGESGKIVMGGSEDLQALRRFDSYLLEPEGTTFRSDGSIAYRWQAERANRQHNGAILLHSPIYRGIKDNTQAWTATARRGMLAADGQQLDLEQDVLLKDFIHNARIVTTALTLDVRNSVIETRAPVRFTSPNAVTTATGMHAAMESEKLVFLADVRGVYEKP